MAKKTKVSTIYTPPEALYGDAMLACLAGVKRERGRGNLGALRF